MAHWDLDQRSQGSRAIASVLDQVARGVTAVNV